MKKVRVASSDEGSASQRLGDENLKTHYFKNTGTNTIYFISVLEKFYPKLLYPELHPPAWSLNKWEQVMLKPGYTAYLPHKYWIVETTDKSPIKGKWLLDTETQGENFE